MSLRSQVTKSRFGFASLRLSARDPGSATTASVGTESGRLRGLRLSNPFGSRNT